MDKPSEFPKNSKSQAKLLFFGGILPILAFTLIEESYGTLAGVVAGMVFGLGEVLYEYFKNRKVSAITWVVNLLILVLGGISLVSNEGLWFKLQPALFEGFFALFLWGSLLLKKNIFVLMAEKQGHQIPPAVQDLMKGLAFRLGIFFAVHTVLAVWAAFSWSTSEWALLKGVGLTVSFILYMVVEVWLLRFRISRQKK